MRGRKRHRKKMRAADRSCWVSPDVYIKVESHIMIRIGPEHPGKRGSARARYRMRRWWRREHEHRIEELARLMPLHTTNQPILISSREALLEAFGPIRRVDLSPMTLPLVLPAPGESFNFPEYGSRIQDLLPPIDLGVLEPKTGGGR